MRKRGWKGAAVLHDKKRAVSFAAKGKLKSEKPFSAPVIHWQIGTSIVSIIVRIIRHIRETDSFSTHLSNFLLHFRQNSHAEFTTIAPYDALLLATIDFGTKHTKKDFMKK